MQRGQVMGSDVVGLGYIVISAEDLDAWEEFAAGVLGLHAELRHDLGPHRGSLYLRMDSRSWRIGIETGPDGGLVALGFEVSGPEALRRVFAKLVAAGFAPECSPDLASRRRVQGVVRVADPSGHPLEFFWGASTSGAPFVSPTRTEFVTGTLGMGHVVVLAGDVDATNGFYVNTLGFDMRGTVSEGSATFYFVSPNERHHSLAFGAVPGVDPRLDHIMVEVDDIDSVGLAMDRAVEAGAPVPLGLGRHTNDGALSFYCESPSGLVVEYGAGGRLVGASMRTDHHYDSASVWGHRMVDVSNPYS